MSAEIKNINNLLNKTKILAQNIVIKKSKATLTGYKFLNFAAWVGKKNNEKDSNTLINLLTILKKEPTWLNTRYKNLLTSDGKLEIIETAKGTTTKPVDVKNIVDTLINLSNSMVTIEGTNDKMSFYDSLINLHINELEKNPTVKQNKPLWAKNLRRAKEIALSSDKSNEDLNKDAKENIESIQKEHANLKTKVEETEVQIKILESLLEGGTDGIIARKIKKLTTGVQQLYEDRSKFVDYPETSDPNDPMSGKRIKETTSVPKQGEEGRISELRELIQEISEGKVDVIEETTEEIQKDLEREQNKLIKVKESIERINQFEGELTAFLDIYKDFPDSPKLTTGVEGQYALGRPKEDAEGKVDPDKVAEYEEEEEGRKDEMAAKERWDRESNKLTDLGNTIESIYVTLKKVSKILKKLDDFEAEEFKEWVSGKAGSRPTILEVDNVWLQAISNDGNVLDTYDNRDIVQMEKLSHQLVRKYEKLDKLKGALRSYLRN